jgi:O-succinylbenzoic acid--CoA ligase
MPSDNSNEKLASLFFEGWENDQTQFELTTSGSTGEPKKIVLEKDKLIWSANNTKEAFLIRTINKYQLCCLPISKVGGFMQLVRSAVWHSPVDVVEASANPLLDYRGPAQIASFTPMQLWHILNHEISKEVLHQFHTVLIGGGTLSPEIEKTLLENYADTRWFHTFGMTETYSHFAGRQLGNQIYEVMPNTEIAQNELGALKVRNFITNNEWIQTNDIIEIINDSQFIWVGRTDFTINSGGLKIQLETVESEIQKQTNWQSDAFFCWYMPDAILEQKLVLVTTEKAIPQNWNFSNDYYKPKEIFVVANLIYTENGKINRAKSFELI